MLRLLLLALVATAEESTDTDNETSRKVLGSSVVTSVSVIMDTGNGSKIYTDAVGKPVAKPVAPTEIASPINLLNPDRYEFYTFDDSGELVKRLMTLEEIQDIIATGDSDGFNLDSISSNGFLPEKRVDDVVNNVQNVLKEEMKTHKTPVEKPQMDTPDVSDSWSMILPAIFGNSGDDINPEPSMMHVTPDTIMIEPTEKPSKPIEVLSPKPQLSTTEKISTLQTKKTKPTVITSTTTTTKAPPLLHVQIITNSNSSTTEKNIDSAAESSQIIEIKPIMSQHDFGLTKDNARPIYHVNKKGTKRPSPTKAGDGKPTKSTTQKPVTTTPFVNVATSATTAATTSISTTSTTSATTTTPSTISTTTTTSSTTTKLPPTTVEAATTSRVENVAALQITTTNPEFDSTTITIPSSTESNDQDSSLPTLLELLSSFQTSNTNVKQTTTITEPSSTYSPFSTFFIVADNKNHEDSTKNNFDSTIAEGTTMRDTLDDLSTLSTEYITISANKNKIPNSTFISATTESQSTDRSTPEFLDKYLLTSTNIYEINSELSSKIDATTILNDSLESSTNIIVRETSEVPSTTTDQTYIQSIEELLSQAVGPVEPALINKDEAVKIQEIIKNSANKTMVEVLKESATVASNLASAQEKTTTESNSLTTTESVETTTIKDILIDSVEALLSQVYNSGSTTTVYDTTTTEMSEVEVSTVASNSGNTMITTPETTTDQQPTTITTDVPSTRASITSTTLIGTAVEVNATTSRSTLLTSTVISSLGPHLINITIIRNENKKPAKADLSLEQEYDDILNEIKKNSSQLQLNISNQVHDILRPEASNLNFIQNNNKAETITTESNIETTTDFTESTTELASTTTIAPKPITSGTNISTSESASNSSESDDDSSWTLVSTLAPHDVKIESTTPETSSTTYNPPAQVDLVPKPLQGFGLEDSTAKLDSDVYQFVQLCNELAFGFWKSVTTGISAARSVVVSPFAATSLLAMVFLGARGSTSGEMNEILKLDDMVTFNPHLIFKNVSESIDVSPDSGVAVSTIIRELYSDRSKGKLLGFYKERVRQFYDGHVEEASFREIGDIIRRRTNLLVKKNSGGKIQEFLKDTSLAPKSPLAGVSISVFETDCSSGSTEGRDGEIHFMVLPSIRQRRLIPIPATVYRSGFLAGYEPSLDATAAALGTKDQTISTIFIIPGQQGISAPGDNLSRLEKRLVESSFKKGAWARLLRSLIPRPGVELQIPRFLHRSVINATESLKKMGLHDLFDAKKADLKGLNGVAHELHLSDVIQINEFATCGEGRIGEAHHKELYPATAERRRRSRLLSKEWTEAQDYQRAFHDPLHDPTFFNLPLQLRPRQARLPEAPRLRFDRPFLYFVRHNPSGLILHMGRFHPRLLP